MNNTKALVLRSSTILEKEAELAAAYTLLAKGTNNFAKTRCFVTPDGHIIGVYTVPNKLGRARRTQRFTNKYRAVSFLRALDDTTVLV